MTAPVLRPDGTTVNILAIGPADVDWNWVACALSRTLRWCGGPPSGLSISTAQHCCLGADAIRDETDDHLLAGYFLLHDAHEWLLGDPTVPSTQLVAHCMASALLLDRAEGVRAGLQAFEDARERIDDAIYTRARIATPDRLSEHHQATLRQMDRRMARAEAQALYGPGALTHVYPGEDLKPLSLPLKPWGAMKAEEEWLKRLGRYLSIRVR